MESKSRALDFPIVSGNVSLYNESKATGGGSAILPTPEIGGVGLMDDHEQMATIGFKAERDDIWLVGGLPSKIGQSLWLREIQGREAGDAPTVDLAQELKTANFIRELIDGGWVSSCHDVSDGGVLVALAEMALAGGLGCEITTNAICKTEGWFGEDQGLYILSTPNLQDSIILNKAGDEDVPLQFLGQVGGVRLAVAKESIDIPLTALREASDSFFRDWMEA